MNFSLGMCLHNMGTRSDESQVHCCHRGAIKDSNLKSNIHSQHERCVVCTRAVIQAATCYFCSCKHDAHSGGTKGLGEVEYMLLNYYLLRQTHYSNKSLKPVKQLWQFQFHCT